MTDRELLELAAKTTERKTTLLPPSPDRIRDWAYEDDDWNPLEDDGEALRLAVKLRLNIDFGTHESVPYVCAHRSGIEMIRDPVSATESDYEEKILDWDAATRRAIVRAAAAIQQVKEAA